MRGRSTDASAPVRRMGWAELLLLALRRRRRWRVTGRSMSPTLDPGDEVLVRRVAGGPRQDVTPGDVVVAKHPYRRDVLLIKRVEAVSEHHCVLVGDNPDESTDSRHLGPVALTDLLGRVTSCLP